MSNVVLIHSAYRNVKNMKQFFFLVNTFHTTSGMDSQQQFCLKWNSFGTNLATTFGNLFKSESLADVTLFCEGENIFKLHNCRCCQQY